MIVPFAPGGGTDVAARIVGKHMARTLAQQIVIQNLPGAGGIVGSTRAMRADPDGYTILMGHMGTHATAPALYPNLPYRPEIDFEPIGMVSEIPLMLVARKDFAPKDLTEFIAFVKANAAKLNVGHAGVGSIFFSTCLLLDSILDVRPTLVPFSGGAPAMSALVAGQVDYECADVVTAAPQLQAGTIKAYAITSPTRNPAVPTVPATREAGLPEFQASGWFALFAPKRTPKPILDRLTDALDRALDDEGTRKRLVALANDIPKKSQRGQQALRVLLKNEIARWTPIIRAANIKAD
ncbi:MAG TPA: tripartite tricarboxylate transporter substrate-binding protein [Xanthobacteraceae bacterium]|jgi:tripartite-type tricarboxylate transporter receptor subunit TctC